MFTLWSWLHISSVGAGKTQYKHAVISVVTRLDCFIFQWPLWQTWIWQLIVRLLSVFVVFVFGNKEEEAASSPSAGYLRVTQADLSLKWEHTYWLFLDRSCVLLSWSGKSVPNPAVHCCSMRSWARVCIQTPCSWSWKLFMSVFTLPTTSL